MVKNSADVVKFGSVEGHFNKSLKDLRLSYTVSNEARVSPSIITAKKFGKLQSSVQSALGGSSAIPDFERQMDQILEEVEGPRKSKFSQRSESMSSALQKLNKTKTLKSEFAIDNQVPEEDEDLGEDGEVAKPLSLFQRPFGQSEGGGNQRGFTCEGDGNIARSERQKGKIEFTKEYIDELNHIYEMSKTRT